MFYILFRSSKHRIYLPLIGQLVLQIRLSKFIFFLIKNQSLKRKFIERILTLSSIRHLYSKTFHTCKLALLKTYTNIFKLILIDIPSNFVLKVSSNILGTLLTRPWYLLCMTTIAFLLQIRQVNILIIV